MLVLVGNGLTKLSQCQPWPLKNLLEGNTGDKMIPHLIRLSFCVQNYCFMNILDA